MKNGNDKGIFTSLYTECKDIEAIDQGGFMEHNSGYMIIGANRRSDRRFRFFPALHT